MNLLNIRNYMMQHKLSSAIIAVSLCLSCSYLYAFIFHDPLNYMQNLISAKNSVESLTRQATSIRNQLQNLKLAAQNLKNLKDFQWRNAQQLFNKLDDIMQRGNSISYRVRNIDSEFKRKFIDYGNNIENYTQTYDNWQSTVLNTLRNSLASMQVIAQQDENSHVLLQKLQHQGENAHGRMQALQVGNEIAAEHVNQLQELKMIISSQAASQNTYLAYKTSAAAGQKAAFQQLMTNSARSALDLERQAKSHGKQYDVAHLIGQWRAPQ